MLDDPVNGEVKYVNGLEQTFATFSCAPGYGVLGDSLLICLPNGVWNKQPPKCKCIDVISYIVLLNLLFPISPSFLTLFSSTSNVPIV